MTILDVSKRRNGRFRRLAAALLLSTSLAITVAPEPAHSQFAVFDAANYVENLLTAIRTLQMYYNQIQQLQNEAQMLINMAKHLTTLDYSSLDQLIFALNQINVLMQEVQGIAYDVQAIEDIFAEQYPKLYEETITSDQLALDARARWEHSVDAFQHTLSVQATVVQGVESDVLEMQQLVTRSDQAEGLLQAVQANNQLLALQTKQMIQMEHLMASQYRAESLELARGATAEEKARVERQKFLGDGQAYTPEPVQVFD
jgi:P-type conjugative transfer protein TrbJ